MSELSALWQDIRLRDPAWWAQYDAEEKRRSAEYDYWENVKKRSDKKWARYLRDHPTSAVARPADPN